jgi:hypothetical protein
MSLFIITFFITPEAEGEEDIEIEKRVEASNEEEALHLAKQKLRAENADIDPARATSWFLQIGYEDWEP